MARQGGHKMAKNIEATTISSSLKRLLKERDKKEEQKKKGSDLDEFWGGTRRRNW